MIFFTRELHQRLQEELRQNGRAWREWKRRTAIYQEYSRAIAPMLPASVKRLCEASLHDGRVIAAHQESDVVTLVLDASDALSRFRGRCVRLSFRGVVGRVPLRNLVGQWWLYEEAHLCPLARFSLHIHFDNSELEIAADRLLIELGGRRRPIVTIRPQDLRDYPIWEFALNEERFEGQDETWIRPVKRKTIPKNACSQIVAADFVTIAGKQLHGIVIVTTIDGKAAIQSGAVTWMGYHALPSPQPSATRMPKCRRTMRDGLVRALEAKETDVFPMRYRLKALVSGEKAVREGQFD